MNRRRPHHDTDTLDTAGQRLASLLAQSAAPLPHDITERLRVARQHALALRKPESVLRPALASQGSSLTLPDPRDVGSGIWHGLASAIPLIALIAGLVVVQWNDLEKTVSELAEIDTALLVDDLPPAAYSDPGFMQFLRQQAASTETTRD